jgi:ectoine hydroxylase-related dioxygenase (phytanoyl-CoA dioxygenase family)
MTIQRFDASASPKEVAAATLRDGAAIVTKAVAGKLADEISADLRDNLDEFGYRSKRTFTGVNTNRCHHVIKESRSSIDLIGHDMVMGVADEILLPHCESYQINSITAIEVCPGQGTQSLHRDDCVFPLQIPGLEMVIGTMWALTDFTKENGATHVVLDSHRHIAMDATIDLSGREQAVMPKGSVLFYLGSTLHGAGENKSNKPRLGLINGYSLGWLRQESNQYLSIPIDIAKDFNERMRCLLGYTTHDRFGDRLGKYYGGDTAFIDKDKYAMHYRPYPGNDGNN